MRTRVKRKTPAEVSTGGGEHAEAGVEGGALAEGLARPAVAEEHQQQDGERLREVRGEGVAAEDAEATRGDPVRQRSFFKIADVVDAEGDPIAGAENLAGGVGVGAVGVVQHGRGEERDEEEDEPQCGKKGEHAGAPGLLGGTGDRGGFGGGDEGHGTYLL